MVNDSLMEQEQFWKILRYLLNCKNPTELSKIEKDLDITKWELNSYFNFLIDLGLETAVVKNITGHKEFSVQAEIENIQINFSLLEWLAFQAHFPHLSGAQETPYHHEIKKVLMGAELQYKQLDLFSPIETLENVLMEQTPSLLEKLHVDSKDILSFIEESLLDKKLIQIQTTEKNFHLFPRKIVFFDGQLNIIGEGVIDKCLLRVPLPQINAVLEVDDDFNEEYSSIEVDEFVSSLRAMSENQIRLVLKINSTQEFSTHFNQMFLEKPCIFTNPQGDYIWAASLEPSIDICEWLCELGRHVEILDPGSFKLDFIKYCEDKLKKIA